MSQIKMTENAEKEKQELIRRYRTLLRTANKNNLTKADRDKISKAFNIAVNAHKDVRRKSGEPYIFHPLAVAQIGATYDELEWAMLYIENKESYELNERQNVAMQIYQSRNRANKHKMDPIPVCLIPKDFLK